MATEPTKKSAAAGKTASRARKPAPAAADMKAVEARITALESGLEAAEKRLSDRAAALESRVSAVEDRGTRALNVDMPDGFVAGARHLFDRLTDIVRRNPITALILIVAFLLVALFS